MKDSINDGIEPTFPTAARVAKRALVLISCACRAGLEPFADDASAQETYMRLLRWLEEIDIHEEFELDEMAAVKTALGALPQRQHIDLGWRSEGLAVLAWALSRIELPPYDQLADGPEIGAAIGFLDDGQSLVRQSTLRPREDLEWIADLTLTVHWRLRQFSIAPGPLDFAAFARGCQWAVMPIEDFLLINNDLALRGKAIAEANESIYHECCSIARERQQAASWLMGAHSTYSKVTCDT